MDDRAESPGGGAIESGQSEDTRVTDHLANERTLLAWSRTGVTVMALGFVVARFGLLLRELGPKAVRQVPDGVSVVFGTLLVLLGTVLLILSTLRYMQIGKEISSHSFRWSPWLGVGLGAVLLAVGLLLAVYLIVTG